MSNKTFNTAHIDSITDVGLRTLVQALWLWKAKEGIKIVQHAMNMMSDAPIVVDGWFGDISVEVLESLDVKDLNRSIGLVFDQMDEASEPAYLTIARGELGVKEIKGKKHNKRVLKYHSVSGGFATDEVPWCGSFVNWVMKEAGYETVSYPARALSWINFGYSAHKPVLGAIAVKSRKGGGHVCFVVGISKKGKYIYCLGGNQGDAVTVRKYRATAFKDFRLPIGQEKISLKVYNKHYINGKKES